MDHSAAPGEAKNLIGRGDARALETRSLNVRQWRMGQGREMWAIRLDLGENALRFHRRANRGRPEFLRQLDDRGQNRRMQVKMLVRGHVIKLETGRAEGLELGADLRPHLPAHMGQKERRRARK